MRVGEKKKRKFNENSGKNPRKSKLAIETGNQL